MKMGSPEDKLNNPYYKSPYSRPVYPSMEEGFIPLSFSSPKPDHGQGNRQRGGMTTPAKTYKQQNWHNNYRKNRGFSSQPKDFNYFTNRASSGGDREHKQSGERKFHKKLSWSNDINDYIHPTMFQDPWKELLERRHALGGCDLEDEQAANKSAGEGASEQEEQIGDKTTCDLEEDQFVNKSADESACTFMEPTAHKSDNEDDISGGCIDKDK